MLQLMEEAAPDDVALCLLSGGASALLPVPVLGVALEEKQQADVLASCVRGDDQRNERGQEAFVPHQGRPARRALSWPAALWLDHLRCDRRSTRRHWLRTDRADPTTFADALTVLEKYGLLSKTPEPILAHLRKGTAGEIPDTPKQLAANVSNRVIGRNRDALAAAAREATARGYHVVDLGSFVDGETESVAGDFAAIVRSIRHDSVPFPPPVCLLSGGETTVTLSQEHGDGGRNQEFVLSFLAKLGEAGMRGVTVLSCGTDGEDGPTDAAGALADELTFPKSRQRGLDPSQFLARHDSYHFFEATGDLIKTGLTETNVMDVRVILVR